MPYIYSMHGTIIGSFAVRGRVGGMGKSGKTSGFSLSENYSTEDQSRELTALKRKLEKFDEKAEKEKRGSQEKSIISTKRCTLKEQRKKEPKQMRIDLKKNFQNFPELMKMKQRKS